MLSKALLAWRSALVRLIEDLDNLTLGSCQRFTGVTDYVAETVRLDKRTGHSNLNTYEQLRV